MLPRSRCMSCLLSGRVDDSSSRSSRSIPCHRPAFRTSSLPTTLSGSGIDEQAIHLSTHVRKTYFHDAMGVRVVMHRRLSAWAPHQNKLKVSDLIWRETNYWIFRTVPDSTCHSLHRPGSECKGGLDRRVHTATIHPPGICTEP